MSDVNKVYEEFWKFIIELDGEIDFEQVKRELYDYRIVMQEVSKVYCEITEGKFSKPNTKAEHIIEAVDEYNEELLRLLGAANSALKSYQYGNQSPDLAESISNAIDDFI